MKHTHSPSVSPIHLALEFMAVFSNSHFLGRTFGSSRIASSAYQDDSEQLAGPPPCVQAKVVNSGWLLATKVVDW